jgi:BirA family biotin operon repressor/biotin-[acetyl-CoA-carboxylase] ligase
VSARLKWPNDVLVGGRKLAGILAEGVTGVPPLVILGIGVNVSQREPDWPPDVRDRAASLSGLGAAVGRATLLTEIRERLSAWYDVLLDDGFEAGRAAWRRRGLLGARVRLPDGEGTAVDLGPGGELLVRRDDGRVAALLAAAEEHPGRVGAGAS